MGRKYTHDELNKCSRGELVTMVLAMQDQIDHINRNKLDNEGGEVS